MHPLFSTLAVLQGGALCISSQHRSKTPSRTARATFNACGSLEGAGKRSGAPSGAVHSVNALSPPQGKGTC